MNESALKLKSDEERQQIISARLSTLIGTNKITYATTNTQFSFIKTKFKSENKYLWDLCRYFDQSEEHFYVRVFLDSGKFLVGHQLFIDKPNQDNFENVQVINTQTAFLLAELSEQTQVNSFWWCFGFIC